MMGCKECCTEAVFAHDCERLSGKLGRRPDCVVVKRGSSFLLGRSSTEEQIRLETGSHGRAVSQRSLRGTLRKFRQKEVEELFTDGGSRLGNKASTVVGIGNVLFTRVEDVKFTAKQFNQKHDA